MLILAIETSCDETAVAIIKGVKILSNVIASQVELHRKYGGVYPFLAKREHQRNLPLVLKKALKEARLLNSKIKSRALGNRARREMRRSLSDHQNSKLNKTLGKKIDFIAVTVGPGLEPCLWTGVNFAKELAQKWNLPIIPVNHIESHIIANFIGLNSKFKSRALRNRARREMRRSLSELQKSKLQFKIKNLFPAICLVVSGGHTQLILMKKIGDYKIIGETRDDAAGECFDKTARILGLPYPGGPAIAAYAAKFKNQKSKIKIILPRPMFNSKDYDFSFSGLKTAVLYENKKSLPANRQKYREAMSKEIQQAIIDVLIKKTIKAAKDFKVKSIFLGGGVTANEELKKQIIEKCRLKIADCKIFIPSLKEFCLDNAVMVALTGYFHRKEAKNWQKIKANANLRISYPSRNEG